MLIGLLIGAFLGMIIGHSLREEAENCPRRVLGYDCRGLICDHRKSLLYTNMASMALNDEINNGDYKGGI